MQSCLFWIKLILSFSFVVFLNLLVGQFVYLFVYLFVWLFVCFECLIQGMKIVKYQCFIYDKKWKILGFW